MTDCDTEYREATLFGVPFEILSSDHSGGRRVVSHEYPFQDDHYNEDLGDKPMSWTINGAFYGPEFRGSLAKAKELWKKSGAGSFFEPTENISQEVTVVNWSIKLDNQKLNSVEFTLELVERGIEPYLTIGLSGSETTGTIFDRYVDTVFTFYGSRIDKKTAKYLGVVLDFAEFARGHQSAKGFLDNISRRFIGAGAYRSVIRAVLNLKASRNTRVGFDSTANVFEAVAIANQKVAETPLSYSPTRPVSFFRSATELRTSSSFDANTPALLVSLLALGYYFEAISETSSYAEIENFRARADALKAITDDPVMNNQIDALIMAIGRTVQPDCVEFIMGTHNALVSSYRIYGNVSQAYDLMARSGGVSGSLMTRLTVPCQDLLN